MNNCFDFALYIGITLASFMASGTTPCSSDMFTSFAIGTQISSHSCLRSVIGISGIQIYGVFILSSFHIVIRGLYGCRYGFC